MDKLTIEQRAQKYNEALEKAKTYYNKSTCLRNTLETLENIFPELNDSEDERIRKELLEHCKNQAEPYIQTGNKCPQIQSWIAWLEKQGEQKDSDVKDYSSIDPHFGKSIDKIEPTFKVGDWIVHNISKNIFLIKSVNSGYCTLEDTRGNIYSPCLPFESYFHLWTIQDAKNGDVLAVNDDNVCIFDGTVEDGIYPFSYCRITKYGFESYDRKLPFSHDKNIHPATKEQRNLLFQKMKEAGYEWDNINKKLKILLKQVVNNIEIQIIHTKAMAKDNDFGVRVLINDKDISILDLDKEVMLHIGAILLNATNKFINNADKIK